LIDVMHVKKNVCVTLLRTLLNSDRKTRDRGHARADLKELGIRLELWLDESTKEIELPTSCITLSKNEFCRFLKKCESSIWLLDKRLKAYCIAISKSSSQREVS
jgi:hypothetical protein